MRTFPKNSRKKYSLCWDWLDGQWEPSTERLEGDMLGGNVALVVKNASANAGDIRDAGSIPGLGRSSGGGNGNPVQYSCLENLMDRRDCWAIVRSVAKDRT